MKNQNTNSEYTMKVFKSIEEVEGIRDIWSKMQWHPNADIDFFLTIVQSRDEIISPYVIILYKGIEPISMLVGRLEDVELECKIGYKNWYKPPVRSLQIIYGGVLGEISDLTAKLLVKELLNILKKGEVDTVQFDHLTIDSILYKHAKRLPNIFCKDHFLTLNTHWRLNLPSNPDDFFNRLSKSTRGNLRKRANRLIRKYGDRLEFKCYTEKEEMERVIKDSETISSKTYQSGLGFGFVDSPETRRWINLAIEHKWFVGYILYIDGNPCSFSHGIKYRDTIFMMGGTGYDPAYRNDSVGHFVSTKSIEEACLDGNLKYMDFGFGDAEYKQVICDFKWNESRVYIYAPTMYGVFLNFVRSISIVISRTAESILEKMKIKDKVKKLWRTYLTKTVPASQEMVSEGSE